MPIYLRLILLTGPAADVAEPARGHDAQVESLRGEGKLLASGRMRDGEGYADVFTTTDLFEAEQIAREDPVIAAGLGAWILRELERFES